jgi:LPXTG-motif cell wall-anchored protein
LYVKDSKGHIYTSTKFVKNSDLGKNLIWGKADVIEESIAIYGGNKGSHGTHEYYVFKVNTTNANGKTPSGQPLPGIIATLLVGGGTLVYLKKRKKICTPK